MNRVAVVTGANRGIGFHIAEQLCKQFDGTVILTARDIKQGHAACMQLKKNDDHTVESHQLDISCAQSIHKLKTHLSDKYGGLDILVNNAGVLIPSTSGISYADKADQCVKTNFLHTLDVCEALFPLLRDNARVVNISSTMGTIKTLSSSLQKNIASPSLTKEECIVMMTNYVRDVKNGEAEKNGWPTESTMHNPAYSMSKLGLTVVTAILSREMKKDSRKNILVNAVCPGWCQTYMGGPDAPRTAETGAKSLVYLALLPPGTVTPNGQLLSDREIIQWRQCNY